MLSNFLQRRSACLSSTLSKNSHNCFVFSTNENSETLKSSAINERSMLATFLTILCVLEGLETETLK